MQFCKFTKMQLLLNNSQKLLLLLVFLGCAAQGPANGGPEDLDGPVIINVLPESGSLELQGIDKIEIFFDELVDPRSIPSAITTIPSFEYKIKTRGKKVIILPEKSIFSNQTFYRISISKTIRDYRGNSMKSPLNIVYSSSNEIPNKTITGRLMNIKNNSYHNVALYHYPISDSSKPHLIVEADNDGKFLFNYLDSGMYTMVGLEGKILDFNKQIRLNRYGISNIKYLDLTNTSSLSNINLYIDEPIARKQIQSIDLKNSGFGRINYNDGDFESYIIPWKNTEQKLSYDIGDTITISIEKSNQLEIYLTPEFKFILSEKNDTTPPKILYSEITNEGLEIIFSEPIQKWKNSVELKENSLLDYEILGFEDEDTIKLKYDFLDPMSFRISLLDSIQKVQIFNTNIKDLNGNLLADSISIIPINYANELFEENNVGSIMGEISYLGDEKIVLNIENIKSKLNYYTTMKNNQYKFNNLPSGQYILWAYELLNTIDSTQYFSGTWSPYQRAAKFSAYPDTIEVRARWLIEGLSMEIN